MRRVVLGLLSVLVAVAILAPPALAQSPTPKVTITGVIDEVVNINKNLNATTYERFVRGGPTQNSDSEFYGRTRGRWDIIGQLGKAKAVMGLEVDLVYGQFGSTDTCNAVFSGANTAGTAGSVAAGNCGSRGDGTAGGFDSDTDVVVPFEMKWMYVEAPLTGPGSLLPFIPWESIIRLGGMDFGLGLKPSILADTDFGGGQIKMNFTPNVRLSLTYAQLEENYAGSRRSGSGPFVSTGLTSGYGRGDDFLTIAKLDVEPFKGLRISPVASYMYTEGTRSSQRMGILAGGYGFGNANTAPDVSSTPGGVQVINCLSNTPGSKCRSTDENRYTMGLDFRLDSGPFYLWPTFFYQFGDRDRLASAGEPGKGGVIHAQMSSWIADVQTGFRIGPLNLEARGMATSGNKSSDNLNKGIHYYMVPHSGNSYWNGFSEIAGSPSIDYLSAYNSSSNGQSLTASPSYDRYGRIMFSGKATYSLTPAMDFYGMVTPQWTMEKVNTNQIWTANGMALPIPGGTAITTRPCDRTCGDDGEQWLGLDVTAGLIYRFAPGLQFDLGGAYLWAGSARDQMVEDSGYAGGTPCGTSNGCRYHKHEAKDSYTISTRIRYSF